MRPRVGSYEIRSVSNPFLASQTPDAGQAPATEPNPQTQAREAQGQQALDYAVEMRAAGHPRGAIVEALGKANVGQATAEALINQADLFAGMMGRPHPADIDPQVREQIDKDGPMMVTESLAQQNDRSGDQEERRAKTISKAKDMAENGADEDTLMLFLTDAGAPEDQAQELVRKILNQAGHGDTKKKRGFFRR